MVGLYATLVIDVGEYRGIQNTYISIRRTLFYHNAAPYVKQGYKMLSNATLFYAFSNVTLFYAFASPQLVKFYIKLQQLPPVLVWE